MHHKQQNKYMQEVPERRKKDNLVRANLLIQEKKQILSQPTY